MFTSTRYRRQRGLTLMEILVAITIFAMIFIAALMIYDRSNREFKSGMERSEMQQGVRIAFEKLVAEVRQAGFDYDRDGFPTSAGGTVWLPSRAYGLGNIVSPISANGFTYICTTPGTSGAGEPTWNTTLGGTTNDGPNLRWRTEAGINQYQQPDEQIEYAHRRAVTLRANLDYETDRLTNDYGRESVVPTASNPNLQSLQFPVVTTGNDEIVTYALRSQNGANNDTIDFFADVPDRRAYPGGRAENAVQIENVNLCTTGTCDSPPYTLYRFTLAPTTGTIVEAPIATNIRDFEVLYYDDAIGTGTALSFTAPVSNTAGTSGGGQFNPNLPNTGAEARARRAEIRSVRIRLTGMLGSRDSQYQNPEEATGSPAKNYRTYTLTTLVVPRNLGKMGTRELQEAPPGEPALTRVCTGWCGAVRLTWQAPPLTTETGDVDQYIIIYDTVAPPVRFQKSVGPVTTAYIDGLDPTLRYFFTVAAVNSFGTTLARTAGGAVEYLPASGPGLQVRNTTTPEPPTDVLASGGDLPGSAPEQNNRVTLAWTNPTANVANASENTASCFTLAGPTANEPGAPAIAGELQRYEILRSEDQNFDPDDPAEYTLVPTAAPNTLILGASVASFEDNTAVACTDYYYRIRLIERCEGVAGANVPPADAHSEYFPEEGDPAIKGRASAAAAPIAPATLIHPLVPAPQSSCGVTCTVYLQWPKVTLDQSTPQRTIAVQDYVITRRQLKGGTEISREEIVAEDSTPGLGQYATFGILNDPYYTDNDPADMPSIDVSDGLEYQYAYTVRARLACATDLDSPESSELKFPCPFTGTVTDVIGSDMEEGDGLTLASAWQTSVDGSSAVEVQGTNIVSVQLLLAATSDNQVINMGTVSSGPYSFVLGGLDVGTLYRGYLIVKDTDGCQSIVVRFFEGGTASGCCLEASADDPLIVQFSPNSAFVDVFMRNLCDDDLSVQGNGIRIVWDPTKTPIGTRLIGVEFPGETGGRVTQTVNDSSGTLTISLPAGARNPIRVGETQRVQLIFDRIIPPPLTGGTPLSEFCTSYQRAGVDIANQNCRFVPDPPATPNSCN